MTKYRIIIGDSLAYPYLIQKKLPWRLFWTRIDIAETQRSAEQILREYISKPVPAKPGTVIMTYNEQDLLADILKGKMPPHV